MHYNYDVITSLAVKHIIDMMLYDHLWFQDGEINMDNDWKLLTLLIGGNDLCDRWEWDDTKLCA